MSEQLQYQRKLNDWKKEQKEKGGGDKPKEEKPADAAGDGDDGFKELTHAELSKLPLAEQLQYQRKFNEYK